MRYRDLLENDERPIHALTHEILTQHGLEHVPMKHWTGKPMSLVEGRYDSNRQLGTDYHDHLRSIGWKERHSYHDHEDEEDDLPAGTWSTYHTIKWEHPESDHELHTQDLTYHPALEHSLADLKKHDIFYTRSPG